MKKRHFQNQTTNSELDAMFSNPQDSCPRRIPSEMGKVWTTTRIHIYIPYERFEKNNQCYNNLRIILNSSGVFRKQTTLTKLQLNNNKLKSIDEHTFDGLMFLNKLHVRANMIRNIHQATFLPTFHLRELYMSRNLLTHIPRYLGSNHKGLTEEGG